MWYYFHMDYTLKDLYVTKNNGVRELFDHGKLESSLRSAGTDESFIEQIMQQLKGVVFDGIRTDELYKKAYGILHKLHKPAAIRYSLKKAVGMLGPTGFPFEKFVAEIFKAEGFETITDQIVQGKCVEHEIDVVAWKGDQLTMCEAKFHTDYNLKSDLKIVLYVKARYDDIIGVKYNFGGQERKISEGWLVTNTKFSTTAAKYAECQAMLKLVGWNYPFSGNLHDMIEKHELIPVTALTTITLEEKNQFLLKGIVLSKALLNEDLLYGLNFDMKKIRAIQEEVNELCESCHPKTNKTSRVIEEDYVKA